MRVQVLIPSSMNDPWWVYKCQPNQPSLAQAKLLKASRLKEIYAQWPSPTRAPRKALEEVPARNPRFVQKKRPQHDWHPSSVIHPKSTLKAPFYHLQKQRETTRRDKSFLAMTVFSTANDKVSYATSIVCGKERRSIGLDAPIKTPSSWTSHAEKTCLSSWFPIS